MFGQAKILLPMSLVSLQVKAFILVGIIKPTVLCPASVTHHRVWHEQIQHNVHKRRREKDCERRDWPLISPRHAARREPDRDDQNA
jgi:hypothetical protein